MRDIQMVLERYGAWAAGCGNEGYYVVVNKNWPRL